MKKLHLGIVVFTTLLVCVVVVVVGGLGVGVMSDSTTASGSTAEPQSPDSNPTTIENVAVRNRTPSGVVTLDIAVAGDPDRATFGHALEGLYDDLSVNVSAIELVGVQQNVATVAIATDDRSSSNHVLARVEHYLDGTNWTEQSTAQSDGSAAEYTVTSDDRVCNVTTAYYQLDFVVGDPIEQLQGPDGTYTPDELIRFAHGSTAESITRRSDGEFITDPELSERIESQSIEVENGTATVTFSIAAGTDPVDLSLASYTKPGSDWSRATEHLQEFVDADSKTFEAGGPYTLRVDLPDARKGPCKTPTPRTTTTATPTDAPIETATVGTPLSPPVPTETAEPQSAKPVQLEVDWRSVYSGGRLSHRDTGSTPQAIFSLDDVKPGDGGEVIIRPHNLAGPSHIRMGGELTANDENGANEPERDAEARPGGEGDGELAENVDVTVYYATHTGPGPYDVETEQVITTGSLAEVMTDLNDGIALDYDPDTDTHDPYPSHETGYLVFEWELPFEVANEVQSDSAAFSLHWIAQQPRQNDGDGSPDDETDG